MPRIMERKESIESQNTKLRRLNQLRKLMAEEVRLVSRLAVVRVQIEAIRSPVPSDPKPPKKVSHVRKIPVSRDMELTSAR